MRIATACSVLALLAFSGHAEAAVACGKISACPDASTPLSGSEQIFINQGGVTKKTTLGGIVGQSGAGLPRIANNAALVLTGTSRGPSVYRAGFTSPGDGGGAVYTASPLPCSLNGGNGDNGSQVRSADNTCWIADLSGITPTPMIWGAAGNGTTNDTTPVQAAITAMTGGTLYGGPHYYCVNALTVGVVAIVLDGPTSGFKACSPNQNLVTFTGVGGAIKNGVIIADAAGASTSGYAVGMSGSHNVIEDIQTVGACVGVEMAGNTNFLIRGHIGGTLQSGCGGIRLGHSTTGGGTVGAYIIDTEINPSGSDYGIKYEDCGGCFLVNSQSNTGSLYGTWISPGAGQSVVWLFAINSVLGDFNGSDALHVDAIDGTATIEGLNFTGTWTASSLAGQGVFVGNTAVGTGGKVNGVVFSGHRSLNNHLQGYLVEAGVKGFVIDGGSQGCGNSGIGPDIANGVLFDTGATGAVRNSTFGVTCLGQAAQQGTGIAMAGSNADIIITGNDLCGNHAAPISGFPTGNTVIANNSCIDTHADTIASATTMSLTNIIASQYIVTGTTNTVTINTPWSGRTIKLYSRDGTVNYVTGGNICAAKAVAVGLVGTATYIPGPNCWSFN